MEFRRERIRFPKLCSGIFGSAWQRSGRGVVYQDNARQLVLNGRAVTTGEDVFPFPVSFLPDGSFVYTADGKVRVRVEGGRDLIEELMHELEKGPPLARVDHLTVTWRPLTGRYATFSIRYAEFDP